MPSPSKAALLTGLIATAALFVGGAYAATYLADPTTEAQRDGGFEQLMPSLTPGGNVPTPELRPTPKVADVIKAPITAQSSPKSVVKTQTQTMPQGLRLTISDIRNDRGTVYVLVFADAKAFAASDYTKAVGYTERPAKAGALTVDFPELVSGPYAVTLLHDENGDQDLNLDAQGYPIEGYGTSNATSKYESLQFSQALIDPGKRTVKMFYLQ